MPELPEVETIVRELNAVLPGRRVQSVRFFRLHALGGVPVEDFRPRVEGRSFSKVRRRGKFLVFDLLPHGHLIGHLRMTGKFVLSPFLSAPGPHHRAWFHLDDGTLLVFQDMRCFGTLTAVEKQSDYPPLAALGLDPFSPRFTSEWLAESLGKSRAPLKQWLMDQSKIAGLGNIYASEILFAARLSPMRAAGEVTRNEATGLHRHTRRILRHAIRKSGTTISDFRRVDEKTGEFQNFLQVYGKAGQLCPACRTPIARARQQQRSTFYCPACQQ